MPHRIPFWPVVEAGTPAPLPSEGGGRATVNAKRGLTAKRRFAGAPATQSAAMPLAAAPIGPESTQDGSHFRGAAVDCERGAAARGADDVPVGPKPTNNMPRWWVSGRSATTSARLRAKRLNPPYGAGLTTPAAT